MKACKEAQLSTQKGTSDHAQVKKVILLEKSQKEQEQGEKKGDVFDRLQKKRTVDQRAASKIDVDLETLIKTEGLKKGAEQEIHKRIKKAPAAVVSEKKEEQKKFEEVKLDLSGNTVIDLSQYKNNIRKRPEEGQQQE